MSERELTVRKTRLACALLVLLAIALAKVCA
jgi:hypothetical protein